MCARRLRQVVECLAIVVFSFAGTAAAQGQIPPIGNPPWLVVTPGFDPAATLVAGVRLRNFPSAGTENEIWVGGSPLSAPPASTGGDLIWGTGANISIDYSPAIGFLRVSQNEHVDEGVPLPPTTLAELFVGDLGPLNYLEITIKKSVQDASIFFAAETLEAGQEQQSPPEPPPPGGAQTQTCSDCLRFFAGSGVGTWKWKVRGANMTEGFRLEGGVHLVYPTVASDLDYVEIAIGHVPPPDWNGPTISNLVVTPMPALLNGDATVRATVDDSNTGNNTISSAFYELNGRPVPDTIIWIPHGPAMTATDGAFDEAVENVEATVKATQLGPNEICVGGSDSSDNAAAVVCQLFLVTYKFTGFEAPIDNAMLNTTTAGQAIPARWRLTDANDVPVTNPDSFRGVFSYQIDCTSLSGNGVAAIKEDFPHLEPVCGTSMMATGSFPGRHRKAMPIRAVRCTYCSTAEPRRPL